MPAPNYPPGLAAAVGAAVTAMLARGNGERYFTRVKIAGREFKVMVEQDPKPHKFGALKIVVSER